MNGKALCAAALLGLLGSTTAGALTLVKYDSVAGWDVMIDPAFDNGCLIESYYDDGSEVRFGIDQTRKDAYLIAANKNWGLLVDGQSYKDSLDIGDINYTGTASGTTVDDMPGIRINFKQSELFDDITAQSTMQLSVNGQQLLNINLKGTRAAVQALFECQDKQG